MMLFGSKWPPLLPRLAAAVLAIGLIGCGSASLLDAYTTAAPPVNGHVYLIRGLIGEIFSRGLDNLAEKIQKRGLAASVHGLASTTALADEIIANFRTDPSSAPIILIGHSSGGDAIISMAERMKAANVPVGLAFGFDPTPLAGRVPDNVETFINLYQKTNPIGGGVVRAGAGFRGRLINIDLREHTEIIHITLDKSSKIHDLVVDEIMDFATYDRTRDEPAPAAAPAPRQKSKRAEAPAPVVISPFFLDYVVPANEPIQIWDGGLQIRARGGENLAAIAGFYQVPVWILALANKIGPTETLEPGKAVTVPQHMYRGERRRVAN